MSESFLLEAKATSFPLDRAIRAYVPILQSCYLLADDQPFALPAGYSELGRIESGQAGTGDLFTPSAAAMENFPKAEVQAMALSAVRPERFGFLVREDSSGSFLVCLRGTMIATEWLRNFTAVPADFEFVNGFGTVHLGFREVYRSVRGSILTQLRSLALSSADRVTFVGHSLGGAVAILAAAEAKQTLGCKVDVATFGGPRVGKPDFRETFDNAVTDCFRVTNQFDIVPHVPSIITLWRHVGEDIEVDGDVESPHSLVAYMAGLRKLLPMPTGMPAAGISAIAPPRVMAVVVP